MSLLMLSLVSGLILIGCQGEVGPAGAAGKNGAAGAKGLGWWGVGLNGP